MRELKFRQALMSFGKFCGWHYWGFIDGKFVSPAESDYGAVNPVAMARKYSHQSVGRADSDNRTIYEQDILLTAKGEKLKVVFEMGTFCGKGKGHAINSSPIFFNYHKIIGNTIENPELWEAK